VGIKLLPLPGPVGANLSFPDDTPAFRCLGPAHVLTHERHGAVDIPIIECRVGLLYQFLCVSHECFRMQMCTKFEETRRLLVVADINADAVQHCTVGITDLIRR
jgi:hypothetical protein